ncbi:alpha/beta fold hydrolase [Agromyces bauzanensis]|uniref:Alpha/beta hydrolase n=1 Tax=Agromyces bauzanensis TaxID=1308924 RepID=A0A917US69_9MICO|nr:alpha/beta hydrolase [Agromyces bauzanensis]GGJ81351.1 alpha/beta hydrolase [Agromyces bauzanensis]
MPRLTVPGADLAFETDGRASAPAVLLLPTGVATMRMWDPQIAELAAGHFVVRMDPRGSGATRHDDVPYSDRDDVRSVLDHLGVERATVVGAGRGGTIALDLALESPERVSGLVVVGSGPSGYPEADLTTEEHRRIDELDAAIAASDTALLMRLETALWAAGPLRLESNLDPRFVALAHELNAPNAIHADHPARPEPLEPPAYGRLGDIRVPALVVVGDYDLSATRAQYEHLLDALPAATGFRCHEAAHLANIERQAEFTHVLLDWLGEHGL